MSSKILVTGAAGGGQGVQQGLELPFVIQMRLTHPRKRLAYVLWSLRRSFRDFLYCDGYSEWKGLTVMACTQVIAIVAAVCIVSISVGHRLLPVSRPVAWIMAVGRFLAIAGANYYWLRLENIWAQFEPEIKRDSRGVRILRAIAIIVAIMGIAIASATAVRHSSE